MGFFILKNGHVSIKAFKMLVPWSIYLFLASYRFCTNHLKGKLGISKGI